MCELAFITVHTVPPFIIFTHNSSETFVHLCLYLARRILHFLIEMEISPYFLVDFGPGHGQQPPNNLFQRL